MTTPAAWTVRALQADDREAWGVGRALIEAIVERGQRDGWRDVFWITDRTMPGHAACTTASRR